MFAMLRVSVMLCLVLVGTANPDCTIDDEGKSTCRSPDQTALLQGRVRVVAEDHSSDGVKGQVDEKGKEDEDEEEEEEEESGPPYNYGPLVAPKPLLHYFKFWAQGAIESRLAHMWPDEKKRISSLQTGSFAHTASSASTALAFAMMRDCPRTASSMPKQSKPGLLQEYVDPQITLVKRALFKVIHAEPADATGVHHTLLQDRAGKLQYMASYQMPHGTHEALVTDPPICAKSGWLGVLQSESRVTGPNFAKEGNLHSSDDGVIHDDDPVEEDDPGIKPIKTDDPVAGTGSGSGASNMLKIDDPLVKDCKALFERTYAEDCNDETVIIKVLQASRLIIDGIGVHMKVKVSKKEGGEGKIHHPVCNWEADPDHTGASLLQESRDPEGQTPEEEMGLHATLTMHTSLCDASETDGVSQSEIEEARLLEQFAMGENSFYVGYEHVYDNMPVYSAMEVGYGPAEVDLRQKFSKCYPKLDGKNQGTETVRNQGTCGSCWVFAASTTTMANLCISSEGKAHALYSEGDRFEISTQNIISCVGEGDYTAAGCNGGNMAQFDKVAKTWGLMKERDNPYKCAGNGNAEDHFEETTASCDAFPWGGKCIGGPNKDWWWAGAAKIDGEDTMKSYLASDMSLYVSMKVHKNFFEASASEVYSTLGGGEVGGHAMNCLGYGSLDGEKYWLIQNSWGPSWCDQGYVKFKRGGNLAEIEEGAFVARAWVTDGKEPPCKDSESGSGVSQNGQQPWAPCSELLDYCESSGMPMIATNCPVTCNKCSGDNGADVPEGEHEPPVPPEYSNSCCGSPPDKNCLDHDDCWKGYGTDAGSNWKLFCCPNHGVCMGRDTGGNYGSDCDACEAQTGPPPAPPAPPAARTKCCDDPCDHNKGPHAECVEGLFCSSTHQICMDEKTGSNQGCNCEKCKGNPDSELCSNPSPTTPAPTPSNPSPTTPAPTPSPPPTSGGSKNKKGGSKTRGSKKKGRKSRKGRGKRSRGNRRRRKRGRRNRRR